MKQLHFYALPEDLVALLGEIEIRRSLKFVRMDSDDGKDAVEYVSSRELPHLGHASSDSSIACETFLVCGTSTKVVTRSVPRIDGRQTRRIDQLWNPDTVTVTPGGIWRNDVVIAGRIATVSSSAISQALMKSCRDGLKKTFSKVKAFYVGPRQWST